MKLRSRLIFLLLIIAANAPLPTQVATSCRTRAHVETLASEKFGGRDAGSDGERLAADYIAAQLTRVGARPLPGRRDMFQPFEFTAGSRDGGSQITIPQHTDVGQVRALSFSDDGTVDGDVVFAGYGIVVPEAQNFG